MDNELINVEQLLNELDFQTTEVLLDKFDEINILSREGFSDREIVNIALNYVIQAEIQKYYKVNFQRQINDELIEIEQLLNLDRGNVELSRIRDDVMGRWNDRNLYIEGKITAKDKLFTDAVYLANLRYKLKHSDYDFEKLYKNVSRNKTALKKAFVATMPLLHIETAKTMEVMPKYHVNGIEMQGDLLINDRLIHIYVGTLSAYGMKRLMNKLALLHIVAQNSEKGVNYREIQVIFPSENKTISISVDEFDKINQSLIIEKIKNA